jgi:hypothetical protein
VTAGTIGTSQSNTRVETEVATVAEALVARLEAHGVDRCFCVPGESYLWMLDALRDSTIATVVARQEGGAAMMAEADGKPAHIFLRPQKTARGNRS